MTKVTSVRRLVHQSEPVIVHDTFRDEARHGKAFKCPLISCSCCTVITTAEITATIDGNGMKTTETIATVTTTDADNNKTVVKTITTENKTPDGSTGVIVRDEDGNILSQSTTISKEAEEKALENNSAIQSPLLVEPWTESKPTK